MKGALTGLSELRKIHEGTNSGGGFLKLKSGQAATVRFLNELDTDGKLYDEERGLAISVYEHNNPDNYSQRFLCTSEEEGQCVGCERSVVDSRWKKKARLYVNVYVKEDDEVKLLSTGFSSKGIAGNLIEFATDFGTIGDRWYKIKRQGDGMKTSYTCYPVEVTSFDFSTTQPRDLSAFSKYRSYAEVQELLDGKEETAKDSDW